MKKTGMKHTMFGILAAALLLAGCTSDRSMPQEPAADAGARIQQSQEQETEVAVEEIPVSEQAVAHEEMDGLLTVTFLDVGQGNAVLVENEGQYMLIDGGDRNYSSYVVSYLQKQGVGELEYVISSHYDADHLNGIIGALHVFPCETLLAADYTTDTRVYQSLLSVIEQKDIALAYPQMGDTYTFGAAEFTVVCPDAYDYSEDNDNSVGIRLVYGDNSFLICGDAGTRVEKMMMQSGLDIASDVYLASHHGSANSSSRDFLEAVQPKAVVISAGMDNSYGHPSKMVMEHIAAVGASLYRTDQQGVIMVTSDGKNLTWNVEASTDFRSGEEVADSVGQSGVQNPQTGVKSNGETEAFCEVTEQMEENSQNSGEQETVSTYILNRSTKKFHHSSCSSIDSMKEENKAEFEGSREEVLEAGYSPCGRCNP